MGKKIVLRINRIHAILVIILVVGLCLRLYHVTQPFLDHHSWRQTDTAAIARNFYRNGFNVLAPQVDWVGAGRGVTELELQVTPYLTAFLYLFFGVKDWVGRVVPIIFSLGATVYLFNLVKHYADEQTALLTSFTYAILPLNVFFTRVPMPESGMLFFTIASLYHFTKYLEKPISRNLTYSIAFTSLAILSKLTALYVLLPIAYLAYQKHGRRLLFNRGILLFFSAVILVPSTYYLFIHYQADIYVISRLLSERTEANGLMWDGGFYITLFNRFKGVIFTEPGFILLLVGLFISRKNRFFQIWFVSTLAYVLLLSKQNYIHTYYQMPLIPVGSFYIASGMKKLGDVFRTPAAPLLLCILLLYYSSTTLMPLYNLYAISAYDAGNKLQEIDKLDSLILTVPHRPDTEPEILYYCDRRGWVIRPESLSPDTVEKYRKMGARYLVMTEPYYLGQNNQLMDYLGKRKAYMGKNYVIVEL